jgi:NAD(P)-dependent dehydrogenase (short-subunit alcohol dehydrogenase family)
VNRKPEYNLAERTVIITGAAGGIGAATARELVARGALVTLVDLSQDAVTALAKSLPTGRALATSRGITHRGEHRETATPVGDPARPLLEVMGCSDRERFGVFHRLRTASVSVL